MKPIQSLIIAVVIVACGAALVSGLTNNAAKIARRSKYAYQSFVDSARFGVCVCEKGESVGIKDMTFVDIPKMPIEKEGIMFTVPMDDPNTFIQCCFSYTTDDAKLDKLFER